ncbi:TrmB family transcriptional regulator [Halothermothrix orenii]|uniref:Transcriptional regulator, TrmB n=1 Tax=Halothermothrix orenii (strain H 168 / OCM 544 / DSM 9562) TaxID=373903 RepID=B8D2J4_HALOH|nr:helix-turn-helix domain-containing protein [Halothermothrix orenii]ACL69421.1 transcriptional regulator, TrmB [Halothermothrix orenii H 168]
MAASKEEVIKNLVGIGFNQYEAKTYVALLQNPNSTAYELSKNSGVPQSKVYETIKNLVSKGLAVAEGQRPVKYSPLPIEEFLERYKKSVEESVSFLKKNLKDINDQPQIDYMWHFEGRDRILNKVSSMINNAEKNLYFEIWIDELEILCDDLIKAEDRGVDIVLVQYGHNNSCDIGKVYYHQMDGMEKDAERVGRWLTVIKDARESLFGIFKEDNNYAIWTQNKSFMLMAESFISHDIYIAEMYSKYKDLIEQEFGPNFKKLRDIISIG